MREEILLWSKALAKCKGVQVSSRFLLRLENRLKIKQSVSYSIPIILKFRKEAYKRYYTMKKQATKLKELWLFNLAAIQVLLKGSNQQSRYNTLILYKKQRCRVRKIKYAMGKGFLGALDKVSIHENGTTIKLTDKNNIENTYHKESKVKFSQIIGTLAIRANLIHELGFLGTL